MRSIRFSDNALKRVCSPIVLMYWALTGSVPHAVSTEVGICKQPKSKCKCRHRNTLKETCMANLFSIIGHRMLMTQTLGRVQRHMKMTQSTRAHHTRVSRASISEGYRIPPLGSGAQGWSGQNWMPWWYLIHLLLKLQLKIQMPVWLM